MLANDGNDRSDECKNSEGDESNYSIEERGLADDLEALRKLEYGYETLGVKEECVSWVSYGKVCIYRVFSWY